MSSVVTMTTTQTQTQPDVLTLWLNRVDPVKEKANKLLKDITESKLFDDDDLKFASNHLHDLTLDKGREEVSDGLCYLLCDVINPAIIEHAPGSEKEKCLLALEGGVRELLAMAVPQDKTVDQFVGEYEKAADEYTLLAEKLAHIEACFERQMTELYAAANDANQQMLAKFNRLKENLLKLNESRKSTTGAVHAKVDALTEKVDQITAELTANAAQIKAVGERMQNEESSFKKISADLTQLLKTV